MCCHSLPHRSVIHEPSRSCALSFTLKSPTGVPIWIGAIVLIFSSYHFGHGVPHEVHLAFRVGSFEDRDDGSRVREDSTTCYTFLNRP